MGDVCEPTRRLAQEELGGHGVWDVGTQVVHVAVGRGQIKKSVVVGVEEGADVHLVDDRILEPQRVRGRSFLALHSHAAQSR